MPKETKTLLVITFFVNIILGLLFVYGNLILWDVFRGNNIAHSTLISSSWNPFKVWVVFHHYNNGSFITVQGVFGYPNLPFMLFWGSTAVNLILIVLIYKSKGTSPPRTDEK